MSKTIDNSFQYIAAKSQEEFQQNVSGLLELHQYLLERIRKAKEKKKEGAFIPIAELELITNYLLQTTARLMGQSNSLHQCIIHFNNQQRITEALLYLKTSELLESLLKSKSKESA